MLHWNALLFWKLKYIINFKGQNTWFILETEIHALFWRLKFIIYFEFFSKIHGLLWTQKYIVYVGD